MLIPRIKRRDPAGLGSADGATYCGCDDGLEYAVKDGAGDPQRPHNEWFCTHLAGQVGVPCPPCIPVEDETGTLIFGSRWEGGVYEERWLDLVVRGEIPRDQISTPLSRILAFDHFVHNDDRHLRNYLVRRGRNGWVMLAMDFSRSWSFHGFPPAALPFATSQKTRSCYNIIRREIGDFLDMVEVRRVLEALGSIKRADIEKILEDQPTNWLTRARKNDIVAWWKSPAKAARLAEIERGIGDGSYL